MAHSLIGMDEVGRGSWAGPLLVVAAKLAGDLPPGLTDSKLLNSAQREDLCLKLRKSCKFGEGWVTPFEIDRSGLAKALSLGGRRALRSLSVNPTDEILLDGRHNYLPKIYKNTKAIVNADLDYPIVSAASIYAKVTRDKFMYLLGNKYPAYGFEFHVGYGTKAHRSALQSYGIIKKVHRLSFRPIKAIAEA